LDEIATAISMSAVDRNFVPIAQGERPCEADAIEILVLMELLLCRESNVLRLSSPIVICGDIHGQLEDLHELFSVSGDMNSQRYLFMGDYVDRGLHSLCTFLYLSCLKIMAPERFFLLRGNHESRTVSHQYGFYNECALKYGHDGIFTLCNEVFDFLPCAAVIDRELFAVHGGLSPDIPLVHSIVTLKREEDVPQNGPLADLLWSDPENVRFWRPNARGAGFIFGAEQVREFCHLNRLNWVARSHQLAQHGYQWWFQELASRKPNSAKRGGLLLIWSAPNYAYTSGNLASVCKFGFQTLVELELIIFDATQNRIQQADPTLGRYFT
jgi:diadenosine tetraphosphatase ApaH/serine/threonine PP2A family protein phosphatase